MDVSDAGQQVTQVYRIRKTNADAARRVLERLLPLATFASDPDEGTLLATADTLAQQHIAEVVKQLDESESNQATLQPYIIANADAEAVYELLRTLYEKDRRVSISLDRNANTVMALAGPREHLQIAKLVSEMEKSAGASADAVLEIYSLANIESESIVDALESLFANEKPEVNLSVEPTSNQLMVVALPRQHAKLRSALQGLQGKERELEAFQLQVVDPIVVESAIDDLFAEATSVADIPSVNADPGTQQLFVRGTREQIERIRKLLLKMGEPSISTTQRRGATRVIPLSGDTEEIVRQIRDVWPQLRKNPLRVLKSQSESQPIVPGPTPVAPMTEDSQGGLNHDPAGSLPTSPQDDDQSSSDAHSADRAVPSNTQADQSGAEQEQLEAPLTSEIPPRSSQTTPLFLIPAEGRLTAISSDQEALDQMESLLRLLSSQSTRFGAAGAFSVFTLRNAGATQLARLLNDLVRKIPLTAHRAVWGAWPWLPTIA